MVKRTLVAISLLVASAAHAQEPTSSLLPADTELVLGLDARTLYADETFNAIMDLVEASESYQAHARQLEAWGFDPRADVHEVVFAVGELGDPESDFVVVVTGELSASEMETRMGAHDDLRREATPEGPIWRDSRGTAYWLSESVAVAGTGELFEYALRAVRAGAPTHGGAGSRTVWMRLETTDELRAHHPALASLLRLEASLSVDSTPAFHIAARMADPETAQAGMREIRNVLTSVAEVPEVSALRMEGLVRSAVVAIRGTTVTLDTEIDAASWNHFSSMLSDLVAEELR